MCQDGQFKIDLERLHRMLQIYEFGGNVNDTDLNSLVDKIKISNQVNQTGETNADHF